MKTSDTTSELAAALLAAQKELRNPGFDSDNPHFKSRFVSLAGLRNATLPVLLKHGISVTQSIEGGEGWVSCTTRLWHSSGQWADYGPFQVPLGKNDAQVACAAATYARRTSWQSAVGVVGDDDDDGETVVGRGAAAAHRPKAPAKAQGAPANADFPPTSEPIGTPHKPAQKPSASPGLPDCWTKDDDVALAKVVGKLGKEMAKEKAATFGFRKEDGLFKNYGLSGDDLALMRAWMAVEVGGK